MQAEEESSVQDQHEKLQLIKLGDELNSLKENIDQMNIQLSKLMLENREAERILQEVSLLRRFLELQCSANFFLFLFFYVIYTNWYTFTGISCDRKAI